MSERPTTAPDWTVVIPTYNRAGDPLPAVLAALQGQTLPSERYEIIVVDDGSGDGTYEFLADAAQRAALAGVTLRALHLRPNQGPAAARNAGVGAARGRYIAFIDDDCIPDPDWLQQLDGAMTAAQGVAGIGGRTLLASERETLAVRYMRLHRWYETPRGALAGRVEYLLTANSSFRREALLAVGGLDPGYRSGEDADLGRRLSAAGHRLAYCPQAVVRHQVDGSIDALLRRAAHYGAGEGHRHRARRLQLLAEMLLAAALRLVGLPRRVARYLRAGLLLPDTLGCGLLDIAVTWAAGAGALQAAFTPPTRVSHPTAGSTAAAATLLPRQPVSR